MAPLVNRVEKNLTRLFLFAMQQSYFFPFPDTNRKYCNILKHTRDDTIGKSSRKKLNAPFFLAMQQSSSNSSITSSLCNMVLFLSRKVYVCNLLHKSR